MELRLIKRKTYITTLTMWNAVFVAFSETECEWPLVLILWEGQRNGYIVR